MRLVRTVVAVFAFSMFWTGLGHADDNFIFRYKSGLVNNLASNEGGNESPVDPGGASGDYPPSVDLGSPYGSQDENTPELTLVKGVGSLTPDANHMVWQCFKAAGGWGNYGFSMYDFVGQRDWIEDFDIVQLSDLHAAEMPLSEDGMYRVAPPVDWGEYTFDVSRSGEACIRIKVSDGGEVGNGDEATINLRVDDYADDQVGVNGVNVNNRGDGSSFLSVPITFVPACNTDCDGFARMKIVVPDEITVEPGTSAALAAIGGDPSRELEWRVGNVSGVCYGLDDNDQPIDDCWVGTSYDPTTGVWSIWVKDLPEYNYVAPVGQTLALMVVDKETGDTLVMKWIYLLTGR